MIIWDVTDLYLDQFWVLVTVALTLAIMLITIHRERRRQQIAHYAVYLLDEHTDLYGPPVADNLTYQEAWREAREWADQLYPDGNYRVVGNGYIRAGRPGAVSLNVLVWDMHSRR